MLKITNSINSIESRIKEIESRIGRTEKTAASQEKSFVEIMEQENKEKEEKLLHSKSKTNNIDEIIKKISRKYGVDDKLIGIIAETESNKNGKAVSGKGAEGIMQLMPATSKMLGVKNPFDVEENIEGGVKYLKTLLEKYNGNIEKALAAYNSGPGKVEKYNGLPPYKETQNYVKKIMEQYEKIK